MKYRDESEPADVVAAYCPLCRGDLVTRWSGVVAHGRGGYRARALPLRVCPKCKIGVRVQGLPARSLHQTREAARASAASAAHRADKNAAKAPAEIFRLESEKRRGQG